MTEPLHTFHGDDDHESHRKLRTRIDALEAKVQKIWNWIYFVMGGAAVAGYLLGELGVVRKLFQ